MIDPESLSTKMIDISRALARSIYRGKKTLVRYAPQLGGAFVAIFFFASAYTYFGIYTPPNEFPLKTIITIPEGATIQDAADILQQAHVVHSALALRASIRFGDDGVSIKAGDYYFDHPLTITQVAQRMILGEFGLEPIRVTIPEGATTYQMAEIFADRYEKFDPITFLLLTEEKEGYLFPDTYQFPPNVTAQEIVETLERTFYKRITTLDEDLASFGHPIHEIVTMASLLEKEAYDYNDRLQIAGVLWHRLEIGMPLQVDAVFGYIARTETFSPKFSDLEVDSPYNTYRNKDLPPGPIGSPSLSSLEAAVKPIATDALFYLHGKDGTLHLAHTYDEHLINKRRYLD